MALPDEQLPDAPWIKSAPATDERSVEAGIAKFLNVEPLQDAPWLVAQNDALPNAPWIKEPDTAKANASLAKSVSGALGEMGQTTKDMATVVAPIETALNVTTGLILGFPTYLIAGGLSAANYYISGNRDEDPKTIAERFAQAVTYQPRTEAG
jgi:hypothetical protein